MSKTLFAQDIVVKPIITEASMMGAAEEEGRRKYTFAVAKGANKPQIAQAVEELFKVKVYKVNTLNMKGKHRRFSGFGNYSQGYTPDWKKAVVTLTADSKSIEFFDGMM
jgi:large subunit ribosomal protein L23